MLPASAPSALSLLDWIIPIRAANNCSLARVLSAHCAEHTALCRVEAASRKSRSWRRRQASLSFLQQACSCASFASISGKYISIQAKRLVRCCLNTLQEFHECCLLAAALHHHLSIPPPPSSPLQLSNAPPSHIVSISPPPLSKLTVSVWY